MRMNRVCAAAALIVLGLAASAAAGERKTYDLRYRPAAGQRIAYEESLDSVLTITVDNNYARAGAKGVTTSHSQIIVKSEEPLEFDANGTVTTKRITFGPGCFSFTQTDDRPRRVHRLPYGGKAVTFRLLEDGTVEQDLGVKVAGDQMRKLRDSIFNSTNVFPAGGVAVGDRWRADEVMRAAMHLEKDDTVSTIFTLKGIREQDGRQVADVAMSAAVLKLERGVSLEVGLEGGIVIDVASGLPIKFDFAGNASIAAGNGRIAISGSGTYEYHHAARLLPPEDTAARTD